jgi:hypothetical protein
MGVAANVEGDRAAALKRPSIEYLPLPLRITAREIPIMSRWNSYPSPC